MLSRFGPIALLLVPALVCGQTLVPAASAPASARSSYTIEAGTRIPLGLINSVSTKHSAAGDRSTYLQRPDLGRRLNQASRASLPAGDYDLALVVADGLSAIAVERHVCPLLKELLPQLEGWRLAPLVVVELGRVAVADEIGDALGARMSVVFFGERPGLSSPDSLGAYITWQPRPGRTDAERNCISNIRIEGLSYAAAAAQLCFYLTEGGKRQLTGIGLKVPGRE